MAVSAWRQAATYRWNVAAGEACAPEKSQNPVSNAITTGATVSSQAAPVFLPLRRRASR